MKKLKITPEILDEMSACSEAQDRLRARRPAHLIVTDDQEENFTILSALVGAPCLSRWNDKYDPEYACNENAHAYDAFWFADGFLAGDVFGPCHGPNSPNLCLWNACGFLADAVGVYLKANPNREYKGR